MKKQDPHCGHSAMEVMVWRVKKCIAMAYSSRFMLGLVITCYIWKDLTVLTLVQMPELKNK